MPDRPLYEGATRKLVLAFDVGTTYSGISYSILDPGYSPEILDVTRLARLAFCDNYTDSSIVTHPRTEWAEIQRYHLSFTTTKKVIRAHSAEKLCRRASLKQRRTKSGRKLNGNVSERCKLHCAC